MNLHTLSRLPDDLGGPLGPPIRREPEAPKPIRRPDGIVIGPDGKMSTDFPEPDANPVWPFPHTPAPTPAPPAPETAATDEACGLYVAQPLKVGDKVRWLKTGEVLTITRANNAGGCTTYYGSRSGGPICWADEEGKYWERA